jgi:hypothetical protein
LVLVLGLLGNFLSKPPPKPLEFADILPKGFELSRPLVCNPWGPEALTINDKLVELGAYIEDGKIVDRNGKEIIFAHLDCGHTGTYLSVLGVKDEAPKFYCSRTVEIWHEINKLKQKYIVIITSRVYK